MSLDSTDITIIRMLQKNARTNYTDIAKVCDVSVDTIIKRYQKLMDERMVRQSTILLNPRKIENKAIANLNIEVQPGNTEKILKFLRKQAEILFATSCMGEYNIFAISLSSSMEDMNRLKERIQGQEGVIETQTSIWIDQYLLCPQNFEIEQLKEE
jgi:Lrp/AsnC family transcriptional regulator for asnA, asnC and gidA